mgnify:CR=1 FL=1
MKQPAKKTAKKLNCLPTAACIVVTAAVVVTVFSKTNKPVKANADAVSDTVPGSDIVINTNDIGTTASYYDYDSDGTTVEVLAVQASDGSIRLALNTCQVCNGSPYAYFEQDGDAFVCQNCGNAFPSTAIGKESGGCNPVPVTAETYTEENGTLTIPSDFLDLNAARFKNWKKF